MPAELTSPPLSLYVHFPWCVRKCPYCDFNSHPLRGELHEQDYVDGLLRDLDEELERSAGREIVSVFIGGGTPSLIAPEHIGRLLERLAERLQPGAEVTLEANPGTLDAGRFAGYRAAGVNRLSVGAQSFDDQCLQAIGRIHDGAAAHAALETAHAVGFDRINIDLMYGLPGQTVQQAEADVRIACKLDPGHVSHYQLTLEPGTVFHRNPPALPDSEALWNMQRSCVTAFAARGYRHYEVSALARPGQRCRHNLNYWLFGDYLGIGAGAHGKLTTGKDVLRRNKPRSPAHYLLATDRCEWTEIRVSAPERGFEFLLNALRLSHGFPLHLFAQRTGLPRDWIASRMQGQPAQLLQVDTEWCRPTALGRRFLDDAQALFLPPAGRDPALKTG
ncbi:MAG: radical SAM family heme chaperone HemW [Gammaproteobacteria bacterium]|nr:radical SAM family heme chaperone HemW [Gammaproteobacteria bacterium]NNF62229.1 radical SAM family heme chaperone HemW [Gammaproteobacteria bacterium]NNM21026.1 radical SAM family heme chaperone HemW [Gammaproteobacteria bacterium]